MDYGLRSKEYGVKYFSFLSEVGSKFCLVLQLFESLHLLFLKSCSWIVFVAERISHVMFYLKLWTVNTQSIKSTVTYFSRYLCSFVICIFIIISPIIFKFITSKRRSAGEKGSMELCVAAKCFMIQSSLCIYIEEIEYWFPHKICKKWRSIGL